MKFSVGDKVTVESESFKNQNGLTGTVVRVMRGQRLPYLVTYDAGQDTHPYLSRPPYNGVDSNTYSAEDIILTGYMDDTRDYLNELAVLKGKMPCGK